MTDQGTGVAAEDCERIFEKFYRGRARGHAGGARHGAGPGGGAATGRGARGTIGVRSTLGDGLDVLGTPADRAATAQSGAGRVAGLGAIGGLRTTAPARAEMQEIADDSRHIATGSPQVPQDRLAVRVVDRRGRLVGDQIAALLHRAHPGDVFGAADVFVERMLEPQRAAERAIGIRKQRAPIEQCAAFRRARRSAACRAARGPSRWRAATGDRRRRPRAAAQTARRALRSQSGVGGQRMRAERGDDLGVDVGHAEIQRVAIGEVFGSDLDEGRRKRAHDVQRAVGRARVDDDHLARRQRRRVEDRGQRLADEARLVLGANDDRDTRLETQNRSPGGMRARQRLAFYASTDRPVRTCGAGEGGAVRFVLRGRRGLASGRVALRTIPWPRMVGVAQLVRASDCGPGGRRFEPGRSPQSGTVRVVSTQIGPVAQLDRAAGFEPAGREFEPLRGHHSGTRFAFGQHMPSWTSKDRKQYDDIKDSSLERGVSEDKAAGDRGAGGEQAPAPRGPHAQSAHQGTGNPNRGLEERSRDEVYNRAREMKIRGRSKMSKAELSRPVAARRLTSCSRPWPTRSSSAAG